MSDEPDPSWWRRRWPLAGLAVLLVGLWGLHGAWIHEHRRGLGIEIDEGSYLIDAVRVAHGVTDGKPREVVAHYLGGGQQSAPLLSAVTAPFLVVGSDSLGWALTAQLAVLALLVVATFLLARRLAGDRWALLAAAVVGAAPGFVDYTRLYHLALLSAATTTAAVACLVVSGGFERRWPSLGWGALVGLTLLARTMTVAFLPALVLAALLAAATGTAHRRRRLLTFAAATGLAVCVALPWWLANWTTATGYLTGFGYGGDGSAYGPLYSPLEPLYYLRIPYRVAQELYLPLALLVLAGLVAAAVQAVGAARRLRLAPFLVRAVERGHLLVAVVAVVGMAALTSSRNKGTGFLLPLVPLLVVLAVAGIRGLRLRPARVGWLVAVVAVLCLDLVMKSGGTSLAEPRSWALSDAERPLPVTDGRSHLEAYLAASSYPPDRDVSPLARQTLAWVHEDAPAGRVPVVTVSDGDLLLYPQLFLLSKLIDDDPVTVQGVESVPDGAAAGYAEQLRAVADGRPVDYLVTVDLEPGAGSHPGAVDERALIAEARRQGYRPVERVPLTTDRTVTIWSRAGS